MGVHLLSLWLFLKGKHKNTNRKRDVQFLPTLKGLGFFAQSLMTDINHDLAPLKTQNQLLIKVNVLISTILLLDGCCFNERTGDSGDDREPVVSPINISGQKQENTSLYLEDTEHWWEVLK